MSINTPLLDFTQILSEIGQPITLRTISRTVDSNGNVTAVTNTDTEMNALVQEVSWKEKLYIEAGIINIGDTMFFVSPSTSISIYDRIIWNATTFNIRKILIPPRINGQILFKQILTVMDVGNFPT